MDFVTFLILLIISIVVGGILHFVFKYYVMPGFWSYLSKVVIGWVGAWLGPQVFGAWWEGVTIEGVYIVPAILGSLFLLIFAVDYVRTTKGGGAKAPAKAKRKKAPAKRKRKR